MGLDEENEVQYSEYCLSMQRYRCSNFGTAVTLLFNSAVSTTLDIFHFQVTQDAIHCSL